MSTKLIIKQIITIIHIFNFKKHEKIKTIKTKEIQDNNYTVKTVASQSKKEQLIIKNNRNNIIIIVISLKQLYTKNEVVVPTGEKMAVQTTF